MWIWNFLKEALKKFQEAIPWTKTVESPPPEPIPFPREDVPEEEEVSEEERIYQSLKRDADKYGLWEEVKDEYIRNRMQGYSPLDAAFHARWEWDI